MTKTKKSRKNSYRLRKLRRSFISKRLRALSTVAVALFALISIQTVQAQEYAVTVSYETQSEFGTVRTCVEANDPDYASEHAYYRTLAQIDRTRATLEIVEVTEGCNL